MELEEVLDPGFTSIPSTQTLTNEDLLGNPWVSGNFFNHEISIYVNSIHPNINLFTCFCILQSKFWSSLEGLPSKPMPINWYLLPFTNHYH